MSADVCRGEALFPGCGQHAFVELLTRRHHQENRCVPLVLGPKQSNRRAIQY